MFFSPFSIAITSIGEERANLRTFVRFALVWFCLFPLPLGVWEGLRFMIGALPGLFSYLFFLQEDKLTSLSAKHIYKSVVLPKDLYGCEVWSALSPTHVLSMVRANRFCAKMRSLPRYTNTYVTLSFLGLNSIEVELDCRRLIF